MAKDLHPGQKNNLDALCRRYFVDNASRTLHGALLDTELLAEVYLGMTRGQNSLMIESADVGDDLADLGGDFVPRDLMVMMATSDEMEAHRAYLDEIDKASKGACLWRALEAS
jgi:DNA polymerase-3 subunit epsilon